jgi:hypothetical protein
LSIAEGSDDGFVEQRQDGLGGAGGIVLLAEKARGVSQRAGGAGLA